jgi:hypothetical protein
MRRRTVLGLGALGGATISTSLIISRCRAAAPDRASTVRCLELPLKVLPVLTRNEPRRQSG